MKKRILLTSSLLIFFTIVRAAYFEFLPYSITQPDGQTISCFVSGDEFYNWIHDKDGYTIIQATNGYYYYAEQDEDLVKPSKYLVNSIDPSKAGLSKWIKISGKAYQKKLDANFLYKKAKGGPENAPQTGSFNNLVVYIRFSGDSEFTTPRQTFDDKFNPTTGSTMKSYYTEVSYNNLTISSTHYPACALNTNLSFMDSHPRSYFLPYNATTNPGGYSTTDNGTEKTSREHTLLAAAINWINTNSPVPAALNIDGDNDTNVDNVCFIVRGSNGAWNDLLWAHRWALYSSTVNINGKRVYDYTFQPESQVSVSTLCHEMFHSLGAPDLYHYTNQGVIAPAGRWDIMDGGSGHMLAYMKWKYVNNKWITSIPSITSTGTYTLNPLSSPTNNCYKIASPNASNQYFVVEYRKNSGTFESSLPGSGLIVYRIDTRYNGNSTGPPDEVYVYRPGGTTTANGSPNNAHFSSAVGRTAINDLTNPRSFLQDGSAGGLNISNVTSPGSTISFDVTFPAVPAAPVINTATDILQMNFTARWNSSATATGYRIDVADDLGFTNLVPGYSDKDIGNVTSCIVTGLTAKTIYYYRVRAYNFGGASTNSGIASLKTLSNPSSVPTNLTVVSSCNDLVTLRWDKSTGDDFAKYMIYYCPLGSSFLKLDSIMNNISTSSKVISGLTRGKTYLFQVSAINTDGPESSYSNQVQTTVKTGVIPRIGKKWSDILVCYNLGDSIKSYQWYKEEAMITGATMQYLKASVQSGSYKVETIDLKGCRNSSVPFSLSPSGTASYSVYPNPASSIFSLKMNDDSNGKVDISVFTASGRKLLVIQADKTEYQLLKEIPVSQLSLGTYLIQVSVGSEVLFRTQIIVAR
jgi:M6 family metalloprotease-like protein